MRNNSKIFGHLEISALKKPGSSYIRCYSRWMQYLIVKSEPYCAESVLPPPRRRFSCTVRRGNTFDSSVCETAYSLFLSSTLRAWTKTNAGSVLMTWNQKRMVGLLSFGVPRDSRCKPGICFVLGTAVKFMSAAKTDIEYAEVSGQLKCLSSPCIAEKGKYSRWIRLMTYFWWVYLKANWKARRIASCRCFATS